MKELSAEKIHNIKEALPGKSMSQTVSCNNYTCQQVIFNLEKRLADLEARTLPALDKEEYSRGIRALANGDPDLLEKYIRRGGKVFPASEL